MSFGNLLSLLNTILSREAILKALKGDDWNIADDIRMCIDGECWGATAVAWYLWSNEFCIQSDFKLIKFSLVLLVYSQV